MKQTGTWTTGLVALAVVTSTVAVAAVSVGGTLYVKAKNTKLFASASPTANVVTVLQPGQAVTWLGADPSNKKFHRVEVKGQKGVLFQSNLATQPPSLEVIASQGGKSVDAQAFASSGAATKALSAGAAAYGKQKNMAEAVEDLKALEALAKGVSAQDAAAHAKKAGLYPVVGEGR